MQDISLFGYVVFAADM